MLEALYSNQYLIIFSSMAVLYAVYYSIFRYFIVRMRGNYDISKKNLGRSLPPYPNGWYIACKSKELLPGKTKQVDISGHNITLFRSPKGDVYALHSYCSHMGANLGIGGQVVNETCIQCPFHGWLFDGETGQCVGKKYIYSRSWQKTRDCKIHLIQLKLCRQRVQESALEIGTIKPKAEEIYH